MSQLQTASCPIYSTFGDEADLAEIIEMFVDEFPVRIGTMESCYERSDRDGLQRAAHQLKGAAGSYGFPMITESSARLERFVREGGSPTEVRKALDDLSQLCARARPGTAIETG